MWGKYFIEDQGYTIEHNILYQDNKSTILLAINGRSSSSKLTKLIEHRYFLIKDKIFRGDVEIKHAPTEEMWSDLLTKPQQGMLFKRQRAELMNCEVNYDDKLEQKNTHPKLLPEVVESISTESVELLAKSGVTSVLRTSDNPTYVPASERVTFKKQPQAHRRSVLSDKRIAELKNRIDRSRKIRWRSLTDVLLNAHAVADVQPIPSYSDSSFLPLRSLSTYAYVGWKDTRMAVYHPVTYM
jgi:hypothetical protein